MIIIAVAITMLGIVSTLTAFAEEIDLGEITMEQVDEVYIDPYVPYVESWESHAQEIVKRVLGEYLLDLRITEDQLDLDDYQILDATVFAELGYDWEDLNEEE